MELQNTQNTNSNILEIAGWKFVSSNIPEVVVVSPSPYYYSPSQINHIDNELHESLINESLEIYGEIWSTLAHM